MLAAEDGPRWISDELYGREEELKLLNSLSAERNSRCVILHGGAGSGKSSLIQSIEWEDNDWFFVEGKFEEKMSSTPYSGLIGALESLIEKWSLNNSTAEVCQMGDFYRIINEDISVLQHIVPGIYGIVEKFSKRNFCSKKPSTRDLLGGHDISHNSKYNYADATAATTAFWRIFSFLSYAKPVALVLDDIHYADAASLDVLKLLSTAAAQDGNKSRLFLAVTYRDDEITKNEYATNTLKDVHLSGLDVQTIHVQDLDVENVNNLVASFVDSDIEATSSLSRVIHKKTAGNPFFVMQFLHYARQKGFFTYSRLTYKWEWGDVQLLEAYARVSDNVAEMLAMSMANLSEQARVVLKVASCLGKIVPIDVLVEYFGAFHYHDHSAGHTCTIEGCVCSASLHQCGVIGIQEFNLNALLDSAVDAGILVKSMTEGAYRWSNDLLQQVAYSFIDEALRQDHHLKLGKLLWSLGIERDEEWMIFMAATQMNKVSDSSLGPKVAELNLHAARLSLNKLALFPAYEMLVNADKHLHCEDRWGLHYDMTLDILNMLAEVSFAMGKREEAMEISNDIVDHGKSLDDKFRASLVLLKAVTTGKGRDYDLGVEKTLELLKKFGEKNPKKFLPGQKCVQFKKLQAILPGGRVQGLLDLPDMVDERALKIQILLSEHLANYAGLSAKYKTVSWFAAVRTVKNACKYGVCPVTNMAVMQMGARLRMEGHYKEASEYAEVALKLSEKFELKIGSNHGLVKSATIASVFGAVRSFNSCLDQLMEAHGDCLKTGFPVHATNCALAYATAYLCVGLPIGSLESDLQSFGKDAKQFGSPYTVQQVFLFFRQAIWNLQNQVENPTLLKGDIMDQEEELAKVEGLGRVMTLRDINTQRLMLSCIYGDWKTAETMMDALESYADADEVFLFRSHYRRCYIGLAGFALSRKGRKTRKKYLSLAKKALKSFTTEMKNGSVNSYPVVAMLEAEESPSKENYDKAITACARLGLIHHEAYMCERAGAYFQERNDDGWSEFYIAQAILLYGEWGATGKAETLTSDYSHILKRSSLRESVNTALQGRTRYSSKELDSLREINWDSFVIAS